MNGKEQKLEWLKKFFFKESWHHLSLAEPDLFLLLHWDGKKFSRPHTVIIEKAKKQEGIAGNQPFMIFSELTGLVLCNILRNVSLA